MADLIPVAYDSETHLIKPGRLTPRLVCASWREVCKRPEMATRAGALEAFKRYARDPRYKIVAANLAFDLGVVLAAEPTDEMLELVFGLLDQGRASDVHIREALHGIHQGNLFRHAVTNAKIGRYSVEYEADVHLGLDLSKEKSDPNSPRLRYSEMEGKPLSEYPQEFIDYSLGDADHEMDIYLHQEGKHYQNLHDEPAQVRAAFSLHLMSVWGIRTDPAAVEKVASEIEEKYQSTRRQFLQAGLLKVVTCTLKPKDRWANPTVPERQTPDNLTLNDLLHAPQDAAWLPTARRAILAGKPVRYGGDDKLLERLVVEAYQGQPPRNAPTERCPEGSVKTDRDTLMESGSDILDEYGGSTNTTKLRGTYVPVLRQGTKVPINAKFNVLVETGRTSCGEPNLQNLPRKGGIRECFVPRLGWLFSSVDYGALEMCTLGQVCLWLLGYSRIAESINAGEDQHCRLAGRMVQRPYLDVYNLFKAGDAYIKNIRQGTKAANFGFGGGMGALKFVISKRKEGLRLCEISGAQKRCGETPLVMEWRGRKTSPVCPVCVQLAQDLRDAWMAEWEEMSDYFAWITTNTDGPEGGWLEHFVSKRVRGQVGFCDGANGFFQGLAADGAKRALWQVTKECYLRNAGPGGKMSPLYGCRPIIFLHDEIILEAPEDRAAEASERQAVVMIEQMRTVCPDVRIAAEPTLMRRWYKEAACARDANGRLVPWEPKKKAA